MTPSLGSGPMATTELQELQELRLRYKAAYTTYMNSVQALSDASQRGVWPAPGVLGAEQRALNELVWVREALLEALFAHRTKARPVKSEKEPVFRNKEGGVASA